MAVHGILKENPEVVAEIEIRVLHYFLTVAREQSFSAAADTLHITQPTLSRQIMDLERELGAKLLIRGNRRLTLTDEGMLLRRRAEEILSLVQKTESEFVAGEQTVSGDIHIGGGETQAMRLVARVATDLQIDCPQVRYHLYSGNADDVSELLDKGLLDFGVLIEPADIAKYEHLRLPATDTWGLLMRGDAPLADRERIVPEDLWDIPLITSRQAMVGKELSEWTGRAQEALRIVSTYNLVYNASLLVEEGMGYALCLDKLVHTGPGGKLRFVPLEPGLEVGLNIVWKRYQVFSKAAEHFLRRVRAAFA